MAFTCKPFAACAAALLLLAAVDAPPSLAQDAGYGLTIADGKFEPSTLQVKAGQGFKLTITNAQKRPAEFESHQIKREKVIPPGATAVVNVGPLKPGTYEFFDDFNPSTKGEIVAK